VATQEEIARGAKRSTRKSNNGTVGATGRLAKLFGSDDPPVEREWGDVDPRYIAWILVEASARGGAVTFGRSRDKAALLVCVLLDGERQNIWIAPGDDAEVQLQDIAERLASL
jgi:hypothetical protein